MRYRVQSFLSVPRVAPHLPIVTLIQPPLFCLTSCNQAGFIAFFMFPTLTPQRMSIVALFSALPY